MNLLIKTLQSSSNRTQMLRATKAANEIDDAIQCYCIIYAEKKENRTIVLGMILSTNTIDLQGSYTSSDIF